MIKCICGVEYPKHSPKCEHANNRKLVMHFKDTCKQRYYSARYQFYLRSKYIVVKDGHFFNADYPKIKTANGLTKFICNFLLWSGSHATRVASSGRVVDGVEKQPSGTLLTVKKWIPTTTRKGTSDIKAIIKGRAVDIEIKIGNDRAGEFQLREQQLVRNAGGIYEFIKTPEQFFELYDKIVSL